MKSLREESKKINLFKQEESAKIQQEYNQKIDMLKKRETSK